MILEENFARHLVTKNQHDGPDNTFPGIAHNCHLKLSQLVNTRNQYCGLLYPILLASSHICEKIGKKTVARAGGLNLNQLLPHRNLHAQEKALLSPAKFHISERKQYLSFLSIFQYFILLTMQTNYRLINLINSFVWIFGRDARLKIALYDYP